MSKKTRSEGSGSRVWLHFLGLTGMAAFLITVGSAALLREGGATVTWGTALYAGILGTPGALFAALPIIAGISLGAERVGDVSAKLAWSFIAAVVALMVFLDVAAPVQSHRNILRERVAFSPEAVEAIRTGSDWASIRAIPTVLAVLRGEVRDVDERLNAYPPEHGRVLASSAVFKLGLMLTPLSIAGIVLGILGWVDRQVIFRSPTAESLARVVMAWAISPGLLWAVHSLSNSAQLKILFSGQPLSIILASHVPFVVLAVLGIRLATRSAVEEHIAEEAIVRLQ